MQVAHGQVFSLTALRGLLARAAQGGLLARAAQGGLLARAAQGGLLARAAQGPLSPDIPPHHALAGEGVAVRGRAHAALACAVTLGVGLALGLVPLRPPAPLPADAPAGEFSALRARGLLEAVARAPHPVGSLEHAAVQAFLLQHLHELGLDPHVQHATAVNVEFGRKWKGALPAARVANVLARLPGSGGGQAVLLTAHYDSVPHSPGAADDGAGVVTILETLRALRHGPPLQRDVIVLLTDGEELGLLGARAFVDEHPWARDVGLVLNFEARGHTGPAIMFETSPGNGHLIEALAQAAPRPVANSLSYEIYRLLPNDTDLSVLKTLGVPALNFAFIGGVTHYHTRLDDVARLDLGSLQHHGSYALGLTRHFAARGGWEAPAENRVYFNTVVPHLVSYSARTARVLSLLTVTGLVALLVFGVRRGRLRAGRTFGAAAAFVALLLLLPAAAFAAWQLVLHAQPELRAMVLGEPYGGGRFAAGFVLLAVAAWLAACARLRRHFAFEELWAGALVVWALLLAAATGPLPGATYILVWPLASAVLGLGAVLTSPRPWSGSAARAWLVPLASLPGVVLVAPMVQLVFVSLTLLLGAAALLLLVLLLGLAAPLVEALVPRARTSAAALGAAGLLLVAGSALVFRHDAVQPRPDNVVYALDADAGRARWLSTDTRTDEWTRHFFGEPPGHERLDEYLPTAPENSPLLPAELLAGPAAALPLAAPELARVNDEAAQGTRRLRVRVRSPRGAPLVAVHLPPGVEVLEARVDGRPAGAGREWALRFWGAPPAGFDLDLHVRGDVPVQVKVLDMSYGLPEAARAAPRPAATMPTPFLGFIQDATVVHHTVTL